MKLGLNLYSIRGLMENEDMIVDTLLKLKEMGYENVQFSGVTFDYLMVKRVIEKTGMPVVLTHVPRERILDDTDALIKEHKAIGCEYIGLGGIPNEIHADEELFKAEVAKLEVAAKKMADAGITFCYHNHHMELKKLENGQTRLEYMLENAPHLKFTLDTYWLQYGGVNVLDYIKKMSGRIDCVHLKDYMIIYKDGRFVPNYAPLGDGTIDMPAVIKLARECGTKNFIVEQDDATNYDQPLEQVKRSVNYIRSIGE